MKLLFNAAGIVKGGGLQVAVGFLSEALADDRHAWTLALSEPLRRELEHHQQDLGGHRVEVFADTPATHPRARKRLREFAADSMPDAVFSLFGPAYVDFQHPHLMGFANAWVTHPSVLAYATLPRARQWWSRLGKLYRTHWVKRADAWVTETMYARTQLVAKLGIHESRVSVVRNSCGAHYLDQRERVVEPPARGEPLRLLVLSAYYPHKNLKIIPHVARELEQLLPDLGFEFVLTLPEDAAPYRHLGELASDLGVRRRLLTVGPVPVSEGPVLYRRCHMTFMPTLLETSTAVFPESMAMGLPIVTTDLPFNRDVCGKAAAYYEPLDAKAAATEITRVLRADSVWTDLVAEGKKVLAALPTQRQKYEGYMAALERLLAKSYRTKT